MKKFLTLCLCFMLMFFAANQNSAKASDDELKLGMSTAMTGASNFLGNNMYAGANAYLQSVNEKGGVNGKKINLVVYDDGYEPSRTAPNMIKLINKDNVFGVIGNVGTPTAKPSIKICNKFRVPFFGPFTGAGILRKSPPDKWIFNYRASYAEEAKKMVEIILENGIKPNEIAFFIQDDAFGIAGLKGALQSLSKYNITLSDLNVGRYKRNTADVDAGLNTVMSAPVKPKAVILVGTYTPCSKFIIKAKEQGLDAMYLNVSFVGSKALGEALAKKGPGFTKNVVVTQVVPHYDLNLPLIKEYKADLARYSPGFSPNFVSLEGYIVAKLFVEICNRAGADLTKQSFVKFAESLNNYDPGFNKKLGYSAADHQASHTVWATLFNTSGKEVNYQKKLLD